MKRNIQLIPCVYTFNNIECDYFLTINHIIKLCLMISRCGRTSQAYWGWMCGYGVGELVRIDERLNGERRCLVIFDDYIIL